MTTSFSSNGQEFSGYLALPEAGQGPGVIVIQEWWGLVGHIKSVADRFAEAGFVALAPDFYHGKHTDEPDEAGSLMMALNIEDASHVIESAVERLLSMPEVAGSKIGVVGFCMGGQLAMFAAGQDKRIGACVNFYGIHPNVHPNFDEILAPVLGFFAEHDDYASPAAVAKLSETLHAYGVAHTFTTYPGTHHAFFNDERPQVYNAEAAADAWEKTVAFFREKLG